MPTVLPKQRRMPERVDRQMALRRTVLANLATSRCGTV